MEKVFQQHLNTHEALKAKQDINLKCMDAGVIHLEYISGNGTGFTSKSYTAHLSNFFKIQQFAGVHSHHHKGVAEKAIKTIMPIARSMMLHSAIHWPEVSHPSLWPMAVQYATYIFNKVPDPSTGLCPDNLLTKTRWKHRKFHNLHVWGCPLYVLDKTISDGKKLPGWKPRDF